MIQETLWEPHWEHFDHAEGTGVRGVASTPALAFEQVARGVAALAAELHTIEAATEVELKLDAPDRAALLGRWLNALLKTMHNQGLVFSQFDVALERNALQASAYGERLDADRHRPGRLPTGAALYPRLAETAPGRWEAECVISQQRPD